MLCPQCGRNDLEITLSDMPNFSNPSERPEIVAITCKARGTGSLSKCRFAQGSVEFTLITELYWLSIESRRAINELMRRQEEYLQTVIFRLYEQIAMVEANRVRRAEHNVSVTPKTDALNNLSSILTDDGKEIP